MYEGSHVPLEIMSDFYGKVRMHLPLPHRSPQVIFRTGDLLLPRRSETAEVSGLRWKHTSIPHWASKVEQASICYCSSKEGTGI